jgi:predicted naringenin-chalcone synthase
LGAIINGFLLTLSGYIPELIEEDFNGIVNECLKETSLNKEDITHWCIHPGGKKYWKLCIIALDLPMANCSIVMMS